MTSEEIWNLQIDGVDVPFYDGYVTVQEGIVTRQLTWSLHVVDYGVSEFMATNQLRDVNIETEQGNVYAGEGLITKVTEEQFLLAGKSVLRGTCFEIRRFTDDYTKIKIYKRKVFRRGSNTLQHLRKKKKIKKTPPLKKYTLYI
ncbi:hypothetical protein OAT02_15510 [Bacillus thuringiensis]|nr:MULTISPECIES: hypothetical protein [Bacillus cereus group]MDA2612029.1 hypothetical protein [Bacillus cereus]MEB8822065.1 hypothetical protein [Bacillus cereus]MEB8974623.1 hypothetical protein [Bacillus cereus]MEB9132168.1 hypothetical protein [Bacillus cereus]MEB9512291.1 hypothetical protein [Bacillus cereus]